MSEDQKNHIIQTAGEMFFRLGIRSVSIDDICHELGMSKKTFYVYFASKDELIEQMLQANLKYMSTKMEELLKLNDFRQIVKLFIKRQAAEKNDVRRANGRQQRRTTCVVYLSWSMTSRNTTLVSLRDFRQSVLRSTSGT